MHSCTSWEDRGQLFTKVSNILANSKFFGQREGITFCAKKLFCSPKTNYLWRTKFSNLEKRLRLEMKTFFYILNITSFLGRKWRNQTQFRSDDLFVFFRLHQNIKRKMCDICLNLGQATSL